MLGYGVKQGQGLGKCGSNDHWERGHAVCLYRLVSFIQRHLQTANPIMVSSENPHQNTQPILTPHHKSFPKCRSIPFLKLLPEVIRIEKPRELVVDVYNVDVALPRIPNNSLRILSILIPLNINTQAPIHL